MISVSEELLVCRKKLQLLENELAEAKRKNFELENQLLLNKNSFNQKPLCVDAATQYDGTDLITKSADIEVLTADMIAEVAEQSIAQSSYVYDPATGMYYDHHSQCYYDAEKSLYYEPNNGIYYKYNEESQSYEFHSQAQQQDFNTISHIIDNKQNTQQISASKHEPTSKVKQNPNMLNENMLNRKKKDKHNIDEEADVSVRDESSPSIEVEDGEILSSGDEEEKVLLDLHAEVLDPTSYIPCIRAIVKSSDHIDANSLYIITCKGGTIGREASLNHDILIPDPLISKRHCKIEYNENFKRYVLQDEASVAGTFVNGKRIGEARKVSPEHILYNMDIVKIGETTLELHIHLRGETCEGCELWNFKNSSAADEAVTSSTGKCEIEKSRRQCLNRIKKKYGLKNMNYETHPQLMKIHENYKERRRKFASNDPYVERITEVASVNKEIPSSNVGHKMLLRMGWKCGQSLGKGQNGIVEPVSVQAQIRIDDTAGLGSAASTILDNVNSIPKMRNWMKAKKRYEDATLLTEADVASQNYDY